MKEILFWCEFPKKTNWDLVNKEIDFKTEIYIAAQSLEEFLRYKNKIKNKNIKVGVWPTLSKEEGYWFSGFTDKKLINKLDDFKEFNIKIDLEPPTFKGKWTTIKALSYFIKYYVKKPKNREYLERKIESLKNKKIILSPTIPMFYVKKTSGLIDNKRFYYNSVYPMIYTSMVSRPMRAFFRMFFRFFYGNLKRKHNNTYVALGCLDVGIYGNEGIYKDIKELKKDMDYMQKLNIDKIVIFEISGLFNKKDYKNWLNLIKSYLSK
ncbi:MAG: hypothetical protein PHG05_03340 [Candidatus Nanoarchaeia archaeon]|nr:hypothetical protein [Candidatus Nanoarchaeia archaeon]